MGKTRIAIGNAPPTVGKAPSEPAVAADQLPAIAVGQVSAIAAIQGLPLHQTHKKGRLRRDVPLVIQLPGSGECELLLNGLELIRANAAHGADVVLGQLGGVDRDLEAANNANELVSLVSHDGSFHRRMNVSRVYPSSKCHTQAE